jgi:aspartyl protease family protein
MGWFFWTLIGLTGLVLILLVGSGDKGTTLGFETNQFATAAVAGLWVLLLGSSVFRRGIRISQTIKHLGIWILIILALMGAYVFRFDLQDIASRFSGGVIPGSPISSADDDGRRIVTLIRSDNDHFEADADVQNVRLRFLVDTGASAIVLRYLDAQTAGIDVNALRFSVRTQTANGVGRAAWTRVKTFDLGGIERRNLPVLVAEPGRLEQSLLGQTFLESLDSYEKRGDRLTLRD